MMIIKRGLILTINMRFFLTTVFSIFVLTNAYSQTFVEMIDAGDKLPDSITIGGFIEEPRGKCSCRLFEIVFKQDPYTAMSENGMLAEVIGIHYNKDSIVTGVIKLETRFSDDDARQAYEGQLPDLRNFVKVYPGAKLIKEHKKDPNKDDDADYFAYSIDNGKIIKTVGYTFSVLIYEDYLPNSSYNPKFLDSGQ